MITPPAEPEKEVVQDVLPPEIDEPAVPIDLVQLQPWHKARKQFIRERQWIHYSRSLIKKEKGSPGLPDGVGDKPEVLYLTLPGIDYLDVRLMAEVCADMDCCLTSTGFLSGGEKNPYVARAKVREEALIEGGYITEKSHTFDKPLQEISQEGRVYRQLKRMGPFHIVNIDACGSIARPAEQGALRLIETIHRIVEFQIAYKSGAWLLFLTVDVRKDTVAGDTLKGLQKAIIDNAYENDAFRIEALKIFGRSDGNIEEVVSEVSRGSGEQFLKFFSLSLAKWLLHLVRKTNWNLLTHDAYFYSTYTDQERNVPSMPCLAFEFIPPPKGIIDSTGASRALPVKNENIGDTSVRAADKIAEMVNLDEKMYSCPALRSELSNRTKILLEEAGYATAVLDKMES